jgi:hypothetical protein
MEKYGKENVEIIYMPVKEEHPDNLRFLKDMENYWGKKARLLKSKRYPSMSIFDVFYNNGKNKRAFFKTPYGAPCSRELKRKVRQDFIDECQGTPLEENCLHEVFGYTIEETNRYERLKLNPGEANPDTCPTSVQIICPLIDQKKTKEDCFQWLNVLGIELPMPYRLGFNNSNCCGCIKGGKGYWNHVREVYPEAFAKMAKMERESGYHLFDCYLDELPKNAGRRNEPIIACDLLCTLDKMGQEKFYD